MCLGLRSVGHDNVFDHKIMVSFGGDDTTWSDVSITQLDGKLHLLNANSGDVDIGDSTFQWSSP